MKYALLAILLLCMESAIAALTHGSDYAQPPQQFPIRANSSGQITQTLQAGEDQTNDVQKVEERYSFAVDDADLVVKNSAGFLHSVWCYEEDAAPTAGTVRITNTTAAGGAETTEVWGKDFTTTVGSGTAFAVLDIIMTTGIVIDFTTTADVKCGVSYR